MERITFERNALKGEVPSGIGFRVQVGDGAR
jgi:hypothetical protein